MPVDERTFAAWITGWISEHLKGNPHLPFGRASVEQHVAGRNTRHDFCLHWRDSDKLALTGEIKMPDSPAGRRPLMPALVEDAQEKAFHEGVRYCFTWNVREFVLFDNQIENRPSPQRIVEHSTVVDGALTSDDVEREWAKEAIRHFWRKFLEDFNESLAGRKAFDPLPIDQSFIVWLEGFLEDPIVHTEDTLLVLQRQLIQ